MNITEKPKLKKDLLNFITSQRKQKRKEILARKKMSLKDWAGEILQSIEYGKYKHSLHKETMYNNQQKRDEEMMSSMIEEYLAGKTREIARQYKKENPDMSWDEVNVYATTQMETDMESERKVGQTIAYKRMGTINTARQENNIKSFRKRQTKKDKQYESLGLSVEESDSNNYNDN